MKRFLNLSVVLLVFLLFSCSSSHSSNDSDIIPDADADTQDSETQDDEIQSSEQNPLCSSPEWEILHSLYRNRRRGCGRVSKRV